MMRRLIGLFTGMLATTPVLAHDFWLQPVTFVMAAPGEVPMVTYNVSMSQFDDAVTGRRITYQSTLGVRSGMHLFLNRSKL